MQIGLIIPGVFDFPVRLDLQKGFLDLVNSKFLFLTRLLGTFLKQNQFDLLLLEDRPVKIDSFH